MTPNGRSQRWRRKQLRRKVRRIARELIVAALAKHWHRATDRVFEGHDSMTRALLP